MVHTVGFGGGGGGVELMRPQEILRSGHHQISPPRICKHIDPNKLQRKAYSIPSTEAIYMSWISNLEKRDALNIKVHHSRLFSMKSPRFYYRRFFFGFPRKNSIKFLHPQDEILLPTDILKLFAPYHLVPLSTIVNSSYSLRTKDVCVRRSD